MISESYIMKKLQKYVTSAAGQRQIKQYKNSGKGVGLSEAEMRNYADKMRIILCKNFNAELTVSRSSILPSEIKIGEPVTNKDGSVIISLYPANRDTFERDSLNPNRLRGVENIFLLFSEGWDTNRITPRGTWEPYGIKARGRSSYEGSPFLNRAIKEFNRTTRGIATASLVGDYKKYERL